MPEQETDSATLEPVAPEEGQPTAEAAEGDLTGTEQTPPKEETSEEETTRRLLAGKYESEEELEKGYYNATAEASRLAAELAGYKKGVEAVKGQKTTDTPEYTPDQLKSWKTGHLTSLADAQAAKRIAMKDGDYETAAKFEAEATKAAQQISLIDDKLRELDIQRAQTTTRRETASQAVVAKATGVLKKYQSQLIEGSPLYQKSAELWQSYLDMGMPDNAITQAQAVMLAAEELGVKPTGEVDTRKKLTTSIRSALKQGVVAGAGKAKTGDAQPNFLEMSDQEFADYKRKRGWD